jgi:hypothetical protein
MPVNLSKYKSIASLAIFFVTSTFTFGIENSLSAESTRYIFKFHSVLDSERILKDLIDQVSMEKGLGCSDFEAEMANGLFTSDNPREAVDSINAVVKAFEARADCQLKNRPTSSRNYLPGGSLTEWLRATENLPIKVVFSSESSDGMESSFGHVFFLFEQPNKHFSKTVTFLATNFTDELTDEPSMASYFAGAFGSLTGEFVIGQYSDQVFESSIQQNRKLLAFTLDPEFIADNQLKERIWYALQEQKRYNFFTENCSVELLRLLVPLNSGVRISGFTPPAKHLFKLIDANVLSYRSTTSIQTDKNKKKYATYHKNRFWEDMNPLPSEVNFSVTDSHLDILGYLFTSNPNVSRRLINTTQRKLLGFKATKINDNPELQLILLNRSRYNLVKNKSIPLSWEIGINLTGPEYLVGGVGLTFGSTRINTSLMARTSNTNAIFGELRTEINLASVNINPALTMTTEAVQPSIELALQPSSRLEVGMRISNLSLTSNLTLRF